MSFANFFTHLECSANGERYSKDQPHNLSDAGKPLLARYDLEKAKPLLDRGEIWSREGGFWKWRELLPVARDADVVALGEVDTPLIDVPATMRACGGTGRLIVKDEGRLPTGSFKARGLALAVAMAKSYGLSRLAMPTNGNAGAALSAYASRAGMESWSFAPEDTPEVNLREIALHGGHVTQVNGFIHHCGALVAAGKDAMGWFDVSTLKEPYRIEGKKTMGLELCAQMGWSLPDAILYPTGGGTGLIGMWKAFDEMEALGWIGPERPKMIAVQAAGCAPIVKAYEAGETHAEECLDPHTKAMGIRVPKAIGDFLILDAVRRNGGFAIAVDENAIEDARTLCGREDGLLLCPEGAATLAAYRQAVADRRLESDATAMLFNCGNGLKYPMPDRAKTLDRHEEVDWGKY
ncbi:threonine synthase [Hyphobacterium marinum]|uniref:Threonine synthase n=1 Tax=Hyphobacterium marinum TaxID=3116574 RepID=A0ABU7LZ91_9PROT|nr:threonine synthase [Hyphobacterium sp. Y6023]MEE2566863.1 threonine synthase [Hyphobacterium sp. Y6023]